jgi:hypothetical protein
MTTSRLIRVLALSSLSLIACGGDDATDKCTGSSCAAAGSGGGKQSTSLLGDGAMTYSEAQESSNGGSTAESTGYVLETEHGLAVSGSFESASPTPDTFMFNSGAMGTAREPGFPGVDIQVVVDGQALDTGVSLSLDSVQKFGYSSLLGSYFKNAALITGKDYVLRVNPGASLAGKSYSLEIRGHVVAK